MTNDTEIRTQINLLSKIDPTAKLGPKEANDWYRCTSKRHGTIWAQWRKEHDTQWALYVVYNDPNAVNDTTTHAHDASV